MSSQPNHSYFKRAMAALGTMAFLSGCSVYSGDTSLQLAAEAKSSQACPIDHSVPQGILAYAPQAQAQITPSAYNQLTAQLSCSVKKQIGEGWMANSYNDQRAEKEPLQNFSVMAQMFADAAGQLENGACVARDIRLDSYTGIAAGHLQICRNATAQLFFQNLKLK